MSVLSIQQEKYHILLEQMQLSPEILQHPLIKQGQMKEVKVLKAERNGCFIYSLRRFYLLNFIIHL